jgi:hypothetical protein
MTALWALLIAMLAFIVWFIVQDRWLAAVACLPGVVYDLGLIFTTRAPRSSKTVSDARP